MEIKGSSHSNHQNFHIAMVTRNMNMHVDIFLRITGRHDIVEILLKVVLSTISQIKSNPFIAKRGPLEFVVQSHSL
jgi:hypothetical protein